MPNVVCVDDHSLILEGLKALLEQIEDFTWVGEFHDLESLAVSLKQAPPIDIILIDVFYNRENKLDEIGKLVEKNPHIQWMIISAYESPTLIQQAFLLNIKAYLRKDITLAELTQALRLVHSGKSHINFSSATTPSTHVVNIHSEPLSAREKELITLIIKGLTEQQIAEHLFISKHTVHTHRKNIFRKLNLHSNAELIRYFIENNLS